MITPSQSRAARAMLKWTVEDVSRQAGIGKNTVVRFEQEDGNSQRSSGLLIEGAYRAAGVEFPDNDTVRYRSKE